MQARTRRPRFVAVLILLWLGFNAAMFAVPNLSQWMQSILHERALNAIGRDYQRRSLDISGTGDSRCSINYLLFSPENAASDPLPLVVLLHGSGGKTAKLRRHLQFVGSGFASPEFQSMYPCIVIAPQCPSKMTWESEAPFDMRAALVKLLNHVEATEDVDRRRVYLLGFSMGGYGCWGLGAHCPDRFAAILPVTGGGRVDTASSLVSTPIWAVHGLDDPVVPVEQSQRMVDAVNASGGNARMTGLAGIGHGCWRLVKHRESKYLDWLFQQRK